MAAVLTIVGILAGYGAMALMLMGLGYSVEGRDAESRKWWGWGLVLGVAGGALILGAKWVCGA